MPPMSTAHLRLIPPSPVSPQTLLGRQTLPSLQFSSLKLHQRVTSLSVYSSHSPCVCQPAAPHIQTHTHKHTHKDSPIRGDARRHKCALVNIPIKWNTPTHAQTRRRVTDGHAQSMAAGIHVTQRMCEFESEAITLHRPPDDRV